MGAYLRKTVRAALTFVSHQLIATVGVVVFTTICFYIVKPVLAVLAPNLHDSPLLFPLFPLQALMALVTGILSVLKGGTFGESGAAKLVWILPSLWFVFLLQAHGQSHWNDFIGCSLPLCKRLQILTTLPLVTSVGYAAGHMLVVRYRRTNAVGADGGTRCGGRP